MWAPVLAVGDGALGFWAAVRDVFPETREQWCWFHKIANVLNALPKSAQPGAKVALAEIWNAEDREHAEAAAKAFATDDGTKWPKAVAKSPTTSKCCSPSTTTPRSTDPPAYHQPDRIDLRRREAAAASHPKDPVPAPPDWPWPSSSSSPPKPAGAPSTRHTWSPRPSQRDIRKRPTRRTPRRDRVRR